MLSAQATNEIECAAPSPEMAARLVSDMNLILERLDITTRAVEDIENFRRCGFIQELLTSAGEVPIVRAEIGEEFTKFQHALARVGIGGK